MGNLNGKVALITGAASGIGRAIAERFIADGAQVVAGDISQEGLDNLRSEFGDRVATCLCDVTQEEDVANLAAFGIATFEHIDIVVANAGAGTYGLITELPLTEWKRIIDLCLTGVFLTLKHGGAVISDGGSIINIASLNAIQPSQGMSAYCAAKAGVSMLTQVAAMELGSRGVRLSKQMQRAACFQCQSLLKNSKKMQHWADLRSLMKLRQLRRSWHQMSRRT